MSFSKEKNTSRKCYLFMLQAKKHQTNVESTYNFNMKELEGVLNSFKFDKANDEEKKSKWFLIK